MINTVTINGEEYSVEKVVETDEGGNDAEVITVSNGDTIYRFSPNATDVEIQHEVDNINAGSQ